MSKIDELVEMMAEQLTYADVMCANIDTKISATIVKKWLELKMTQEQFAEYLNMTKDEINQIESGNYNYNIEELSEIFEKLGIEWDISMKDVEE
jgi:DNA-binding XRE family transcriptional regulator